MLRPYTTAAQQKAERHGAGVVDRQVFHLVGGDDRGEGFEDARLEVWRNSLHVSGSIMDRNYQSSPVVYNTLDIAARTVRFGVAVSIPVGPYPQVTG